MKYFQVFKAGKYPQGEFTQKDVEEIAKNYDPSFCEAPITIDHEQTGPAYGWVDKVKTDGDILQVSFKDTPKSFQDDVNAGKYKKVSVELYKNLEGKGHYLKAVSFLGAAIPQVKGLEPVKFMDSESEIFEFEVLEDETENFTQDEIDDLKKQVEDLENQIAKFKEKDKQKEQKLETIKSLKDKISALTNKVSTFKEKAQGKEQIEQELNDIKTALKNKEYEDFIEKQINDGKLVPANKDVVLSIFKELDNVKKFGEDTELVSSFKSFIESLPKQIVFDETATNKNKVEGGESDKFANADEDSLEIFNQAQELAKKENISFKEALLRLDTF
ncbi:hypothetical protein J6I39_06800 [bacterium]|nr:hypothetical protein [bacterium]